MYYYETHVLCVIVQDKLSSLKNLSGVKMIVGFTLKLIHPLSTRAFKSRKRVNGWCNESSKYSEDQKAAMRQSLWIK